MAELASKFNIVCDPVLFRSMDATLYFGDPRKQSVDLLSKTV